LAFFIYGRTKTDVDEAEIKEFGLTPSVIVKMFQIENYLSRYQAQVHYKLLPEPSTSLG
jgi:hypothetical protein